MGEELWVKCEVVVQPRWEASRVLEARGAGVGAQVQENLPDRQLERKACSPAVVAADVPWDLQACKKSAGP